MKALIIKPKSQSEAEFLSNLLKKLGIASKAMELEEMEDYGLSILMKGADRNKKVSRETIMRKLKS